MAVPYLLTQKGNPEAPKKFYAQAKVCEELTFRKLSKKTAEKFHASLIKGVKVTFRPCINLKEMLATLKYEKAKQPVFQRHSKRRRAFEKSIASKF
jgi:hypothetical protein